MGEQMEIAVHKQPVWRDHANYILQADLSAHGLPGRFEQLWARELGQGHYELCCLPFFTYGYALGDVVRLEPSPGKFGEVLGPIVTRSERNLVRVAFTGKGPKLARQEELHAALIASGRPHEWRGGGLVSIDIERMIPRVIRDTIDRLTAAGDAEWEWGRAPISDTE